MKTRALFTALMLALVSLTPASALDAPPKVAIAYDIGFLGDNSYNDAVNQALVIAEKRYGLSEPFVREVPTNGTAVDRLSRIRFLAKSGYTLIIAVGAGYRETVRRVSIENPEIQFAIINDKVLGQMNISNIYFKESDGAYLAGVLAASVTKRNSVGFVGSEPDLLASFSKGVRATSKKVKVVNIPFPDEIETLKSALSKVDVAYSTWDGDATVLSVVVENFSKSVGLIAERPDQYFANLPGAQKVLIATIEKSLVRPINQLVSAALQGRAIIDVIDEEQGIYGREYSVRNGGISLKLLSPSAKKVSARVNSAISAIKTGKVSTTP